MDVDLATAQALGFQKLKYAFVERERRWLLRDLPADRVASAEAITDLYVTGTRLRLREARPLDGGPAQRRLARKADVDAATRLITSIYLSEAEFDLLKDLPGRVLRKTRHYLSPRELSLSVDVFEGPLAGLILAEAEFDSDAAMAAFPTPDFAVREVTEDPRYSGGWLVEHGLPQDAPGDALA
jgi:CYTH domain-containing protein